jgi:hypothetical protein
MEQQRASLLLQQPLQPSQEDPMEQQRASLLLQMPLEPQGGNVAAPHLLQPQMLREYSVVVAEAPTTASSLTQGQMERISANREAALRRRQQQQQPQELQLALPRASLSTSIPEEIDHETRLQHQTQQQQAQPRASFSDQRSPEEIDHDTRIQHQELLQLHQQQLQLQPQDAVAQQTQLEITTAANSSEQQRPSGGQQATAQSSDIHKCVICLEDLQVMAIQALPCMHCFHKVCLDDWQRCTGKPFHHCPLKCHLNIQSLVAEDSLGSLGSAEDAIGVDGSEDQQEPDAMAPNAAELTQLIEEALAN